MKRVVVVGAAGFGRECLDVLDAMVAAGADLEVVGVVDDAPAERNLARLRARHVTYLGTRQDQTANVAATHYVMGIGDPAIRERLVQELDATGLQPLVLRHPSATIGASTELADGVVVCAGAAISNNVRLGRHVHVNPNATIGHDAVLHDFVSINPAATISGEVDVDSRTLVGAAATILQGLAIGSDVVVGAGAVVTRDVPAGVIAKGVPARFAARPEQAEESDA